MQICKKMKSKKRPTFDSKQQRIIFDENGQPVQPPQTPTSSTTSTETSATRRSRVKGKLGATSGSNTDSEAESTKNGVKKTNWREQHQEFIRTVRAARGVNVDKPDSGSKTTKIAEDGSVIETKKVPAGYVTCPHCDRNFNKGAADRHIPWCRDQKARYFKSQEHPITPNTLTIHIRVDSRKAHKPTTTRWRDSKRAASTRHHRSARTRRTATR